MKKSSIKCLKLIRLVTLSACLALLSACSEDPNKALVRNTPPGGGGGGGSQKPGVGDLSPALAAMALHHTAEMMKGVSIALEANIPDNQHECAETARQTTDDRKTDLINVRYSCPSLPGNRPDPRGWSGTENYSVKYEVSGEELQLKSIEKKPSPNVVKLHIRNHLNQYVNSSINNTFTLTQTEEDPSIYHFEYWAGQSIQHRAQIEDVAVTELEGHIKLNSGNIRESVITDIDVFKISLNRTQGNDTPLLSAEMHIRLPADSTSGTSTDELAMSCGRVQGAINATQRIVTHKKNSPPSSSDTRGPLLAQARSVSKPSSGYSISLADCQSGLEMLSQDTTVFLADIQALVAPPRSSAARKGTTLVGGAGSGRANSDDSGGSESD